MRYHLETGQRRYMRNPNANCKAGDEFIYTGEDEKFDDSAFVPAEIKAGKLISYYYIVCVSKKCLISGDALIFHGETVHKSDKSIKYRIQ